MKTPRTPLFLERETYRRRRLMDAARILPIVGFVMILLPVLWSGGDPSAAEEGITTAQEGLYLFGLWIVLVLAAALLARPLRKALHPEGRQASDTTPPPQPREPGMRAE